jgi:hypothetical protein
MGMRSIGDAVAALASDPYHARGATCGNMMLIFSAAQLQRLFIACSRRDWTIILAL